MLSPVTNPVAPVIAETVAPESVGIVTTVTDVVPKGTLIVPPFVIAEPLIVNVDKAVVLLT